MTPFFIESRIFILLFILLTCFVVCEASQRNERSSYEFTCSSEWICCLPPLCVRYRISTVTFNMLSFSEMPVFVTQMLVLRTIVETRQTITIYFDSYCFCCVSCTGYWEDLVFCLPKITCCLFFFAFGGFYSDLFPPQPMNACLICSKADPGCRSTTLCGSWIFFSFLEGHSMPHRKVITYCLNFFCIVLLLHKTLLLTLVQCSVLTAVFCFCLSFIPCTLSKFGGLFCWHKNSLFYNLQFLKLIDKRWNTQK